jgi:3-deoxy-D-manno-octulosonic-acid transferase
VTSSIETRAPGVRGGERLALAAYSAGLGALAPIGLPLLALHPRLRGGLGERLGLSPRTRHGCAEPIWLHGASAGDVAALIPLASRLQRGGIPIVLSAWTRAGHQLALRRGAGGLGEVFRAPIDLGFAVRSAIARLRPRLLVLECLELWPRLVRSCARRGIPVAVVNGRVSERSLRRYRLAPWLFRRCFAGLARVWAVSEADAERFRRAGVPGRRVEVESSSKHGSLPELEGSSSSPRLVLGSLHLEEAIALAPWIARLRREVGVQISLAPRYPGEVRQVLRALSAASIPCLRSSGRPRLAEELEVIDEMGGLADRYRGAALALVGGSLLPWGGHNLIEPAGHGVPVLFGPHTEHCVEEAEALLASGGGERVEGGEAFYRRALALLSDPDLRAAASLAARATAERLAGAADRIAEGLAALAGSSC